MINDAAYSMKTLQPLVCKQILRARSIVPKFPLFIYSSVPLSISVQCVNPSQSKDSAAYHEYTYQLFYETNSSSSSNHCMLNALMQLLDEAQSLTRTNFMIDVISRITRRTFHQIFCQLHTAYDLSSIYHCFFYWLILLI